MSGGLPGGGWGSSSRCPPYIYIYMLSPKGPRYCVQNFWVKFPKVEIAPKNQLKNFQKKIDFLDFTYYQMVFILDQHLIIYVGNDYTPECIKYYRSSFLLAAYNGEKSGDFILWLMIKNNTYTTHHTY